MNREKKKEKRKKKKEKRKKVSPVEGFGGRPFFNLWNSSSPTSHACHIINALGYFHPSAFILHPFLCRALFVFSFVMLRKISPPCGNYMTR
jgi:hypothetical protein